MVWSECADFTSLLLFSTKLQKILLCSGDHISHTFLFKLYLNPELLRHVLLSNDVESALKTELMLKTMKKNTRTQTKTVTEVVCYHDFKLNYR